ncbi:MAG: hypothetical protein IT176_14465 [Acidobacteria bacterium]|nr:hypothetical protein [Acidobacteriota bacterium]
MRRPAAPLAEERSFGRAVGGVLILYAAYAGWHGRSAPAVAAAGAGIVLIGLASSAPAGLKWPSKAWWTLAHALGWLNTRLLLTVFYALVFVPVGLLFRIIGRDLLDLRGTGSSWRPYTPRTPRHYERMY